MEVGCTKDSKYYHYHRIISHPTKDCLILKDKIQALVEARVLCLNDEKKQVTTNVVSVQFGKVLLKVGVSNGAMIPKVIVRIINVDPHHHQAHGLVPVPTAVRSKDLLLLSFH